MSTNTHSDTPHASPASTPVEPDTRSGGTDDGDPTSVDPFETHNSAATFSTDSTHRLPNTIDGENTYTGSTTTR
jgi:hypothetical protein